MNIKHELPCNTQKSPRITRITRIKMILEIRGEKRHVRLSRIHDYE